MFAPTRLVPVPIRDQPRAGSHGFATDCITGTLMDVRVIRFVAADTQRHNLVSQT